ncbi:hypothetical protein [Cellulomonas xiejunii]|uniref:RAMA domain-containing protein n=1 Tax=Cellulomonas xiejunii TaxID=2968083 RepID=A0ABY5KPT9_9CELL|nr:hypothetical protein [Cellulomonas xiejunii]MCC2313886.1 hypothetical protein [Cellulomonas xiejunii]MCC2322469.1 hypothetical protein [Cellulomonas xiejunii]UUI72512.1 hypothetical protein NP048_03340 [Cellulomonas xiejunii]
MPIFELDDGRPRLVQPMQPLAGSFAQEVTALVTHHLAAIAGEPLFVVRARGSSDRAELPELLALDAAGRPVVVAVAQVLDDDAIVAALRHGGAAARMTTADLARAYHVDPSRFAVDFAAFREHVPFGAAAGRGRTGVRLLLLCSEVAAEATDTLGFLRGGEHQVDVMQVGVVRGDERRLLEVSPLALHEGVRRTVEPTALRLVRSSEAFATAMAYEPDRTGLPSGRGKSLPTGELRAVTPPERTEPPAPTPIGRRGSVTEPTPLPFRTAGPTAQPPEPPADAPRHGGPGRPDVTEWPRDASVLPSASMLEGPPTLTPVAGLRAAVVDGAGVRPADVDAPTPPRGQPVGERSDHDVTQPQRPDWPYPELAMLAKRRRAVTTLVWVRERRGQRFSALLRSDGMIELPDGRVVADPDVAAATVSGVEGVDGWRAWRLGDGGPTLSEATGAL